ncbi:MAG: hypothetical protein F4238_06345 [Gemmatimonadetes bacterium]|nr:hypothetical protein [Gemmatimonadota bacterium]
MNSRHGFLFAVASAVLFLGAVHVPAPSVLFQLNCSKSESVRKCFERFFYDVEEFTETDSERLFAALDAAEWEGLKGDNAADCQKVLNAVNSAYYGGGADLYTGMPDWEAQDSAASKGIVVAGHLPHPDGPAILFHSELLDFKHDLLSSALHEAAHYGGIGHDDEFSNYDAEKCAKIPVNEDDDDEPGEGTGETPTTENCDEKLQWVPPVTQWQLVKPESTQSEGSSNPGIPGVTPAHIGEITVSVESGKWVEVEIEEGYWKTVTVCTES